jgi:cytochrome c2
VLRTLHPVGLSAVVPVVVGCLVLATSCSSPDASTHVEQYAPESNASTSAAVRPPVGDPGRGRELVERFECARCHEVPDVVAPPLTKQCVGCHAAIADGGFEAPKALLAEWRGRLHSLPAAPSLTVARQLLRPSWIQDFLLSPHDLRPNLAATMPRLAISPAEAADVAAFLAGPPTSALPPFEGDVEHGRQLFDDKGCSACHAFSGAGHGPPSAVGSLAVVLAPDLRWTRERLRPDRLVAWIENPRAVVADARMPHTPLKRSEAEALAAFVAQAPLGPAPTLPTVTRLPVLERPVGYEEVREQVFHKVCWHCHSQPDFARGDGGPGMSGGFGFPPLQLDFSTYDAIQGGYVNHAGEPVSLFKPTGPERLPVLLSVLLSRQREERGGRGDHRGMPLGLPALSAQDVQLVESWIAQGRPR